MLHAKHSCSLASSSRACLASKICWPAVLAICKHDKPDTRQAPHASSNAGRRRSAVATGKPAAGRWECPLDSLCAAVPCCLCRAAHPASHAAAHHCTCAARHLQLRRCQLLQSTAGAAWDGAGPPAARCARGPLQTGQLQPPSKAPCFTLLRLLSSRPSLPQHIDAPPTRSRQEVRVAGVLALAATSKAPGSAAGLSLGSCLGCVARCCPAWCSGVPPAPAAAPPEAVGAAAALYSPRPCIDSWRRGCYPAPPAAAAMKLGKSSTGSADAGANK